MSAERQSQSFADALEDHGKEGLEILMENSSVLAHGIIYILAGILSAVFIWSFFGKADVIITVKGKLEPKMDMKRIYVPAAGDLIDINVSEGTVVSRNDLLARIKAPEAIRAASAAVKAEIQFEEAALEKEMFPEKRKMLEKEVENIKEQIETKERELNQLKQKGLGSIDAAKRNKLQSTQTQLNETARERNTLREIYEKYRRLYDTEGHGGISENDLNEKRNQYLKTEDAYRRQSLDGESLEIEFSKQKTEADVKINQTYIEVLELRVKLKNKEMEYKNAEKQVNMKYNSALAEKDAADIVMPEDLDQDGFLKIRAPLDGEITHIASTQRGEKVKAEDPLFSIAPSDAEKVLTVSIPDKDRGLIKEGLPVILKFTAFPYQQYGAINGTLEYISSSVKPSKDDGQQKDKDSLYEGRVILERDYFEVNGKKIKIRYGMTAQAEIAVEKRRMIDMVLDPFKKMKK